MEVNESSGWELSKENIQPLSSGRKMSFLTHSLDRADEGELSKRDWEAYLSEYDGPDPLEPWLKYIEYMEQSCPTGGKMNAKYENVLNRCFQQCCSIPQYRNDRRFIEVYLKAIQNFPPSKRADLIRGVLSRGFGVVVSKMYLALANCLEAIQNFQEASKALMGGIDAQAQPLEILQDELLNLQHRVAERLAKKMQDGDSDEPLRNFGMNVPVCHLTNEAQNVRVALSPSQACRARPVQQKNEPAKVPIFQGFGDEESDPENRKPQPTDVLQPAKEAELKRSEQENLMKPKKWSNEFMPPPPTVFTATNLPPVEIYVEEPEIQPKKDDRRIAKGVLSERKVSEEEMKPPAVPGQEKAYRKNQIIQGRDREISFEHLRAKEYMKKVGVSTLRALINVEKRSAPTAHKRPRNTSPLKPLKQPTTIVAAPAPAVNPAFRDNANEITLSRENAELKRSLAEATKEKLELTESLNQRDVTIKKLKEALTEYQTALDEERKRLSSVNNDRTDLMNQLRMQEEYTARLEREQAEYAQLLAEERLIVEKLKKEKELMRQQFEEEKARMQQEFERERNESLLSFRMEHHRSVHHEEEKLASFTTEVQKENVSPPRAKSAVPIVPMPAEPNKLGFTLYESKMDVSEEVPKLDEMYRNAQGCDNTAGSLGAVPVRPNVSSLSSLKSNSEFAMPPPPPKFCEEDKENVATDGSRASKHGRALTGILQPAKTAEPTELIYTEEEDEDVIVKNQPDSVADFNVTDLTRALQLYPQPLTNSTPEKNSKDATCELPQHLFQRRRPLSIEIPRFELPGPTEDADPKGDVEPIEYDDDPQTLAGKSHGLSMHPNLSPIPETSKERWSSCTSSSSSTNMTQTRATGNFSHGSSYSATKFAPRTGNRYNAPQRKPADATY